MKRALERHDGREAVVVPVIMREVDWSGAPFAKLQVLPDNGKAVSSSFWKNRDEALTNVARGLRAVIEKFRRDENGNTHHLSDRINHEVGRNLTLHPGTTDISRKARRFEDEVSDLYRLMGYKVEWFISGGRRESLVCEQQIRGGPRVRLSSFSKALPWLAEDPD